MSRFVKLFVTVGTALCLVGGLHATRYFGPSIYLDDGGKKVEGSPEFYWGLEVRRISRDFHPPENLVVSKETVQKPEGENRRSGLRRLPKTQQKSISKILIWRCMRHESSQPTPQKPKNNTNKLALRSMPLRAGRQRRCPLSLIPNLQIITRAQPHI